MSGGKGPFVIVAVVIVGCLGAGVALATFIEQAAALVVSVVLACAVASLLYGILGGVSQAGFNFGPLKMGGSAAVLLGSVFLFNQTLEPQLREIREYNLEEAVDLALSDAEFDFDRHVDPPANWFAIDRATAVPIDVGFTDPQGNEPMQVVRRPFSPNLRLRLEPQDESSFLVLGVDADSGDGLGHIQMQQLRNVIGSFGEFTPERIYGPRRLHLVAEGILAEDTPREWGSSGRCLGTSLPMRLRAVRFDQGYADYEVFVCGGSGDAAPDHESSLASGDGELVELEIGGDTRHFLIAVLAANHLESPFWSSFLVTEMAED